MESQTNLMNNPRFIKVFPTELCHLYLSPMKCIITLQLSKSFHTGLISRSFPQPKFCTIRQSNLLCISCSIRIVTYITYLNVYIILTIIEPYTPIRCVAMTVWPIVAEKVALANYLPPYFCSYIAKLFLFSASVAT